MKHDEKKLRRGWWPGRREAKHVQLSLDKGQGTIPVPTKRKLNSMKKLIDDMMLVLVPTIYTTLDITIESPSNIECIQSAYYSLQDALEALEDIQ